MTVDTTQDTKPWFRQFYPWFLIALPLSVVIASFVTIYLANKYADDMVVDDYYKDGLGINRVIDQQKLADQLNLSANAHYDIDKGQVHISINGDIKSDGQILTLSLVHATLADMDTSVTLRETNKHTYQGTLSNPGNGKWRMILEPEDKSWRLDSIARFPDQLQWQLTPKI